MAEEKESERLNEKHESRDRDKKDHEGDGRMCGKGRERERHSQKGRRCCTEN